MVSKKLDTKMKTLLNIAVVAVIAASHALAEGDAYTQTPTGLIHGPYRFEVGEVVQGGRIVIPSKRKIEFQKRLEHTIIPAIQFQQTDVRSIVAFLQAASRKYSPESLSQGEIKLELDLSGYLLPRNAIVDPFAPEPQKTDPPPVVTFSALRISILEAVQIVADVTALRCTFHEAKVTLTPKSTLNVQPIGAP
jgi:hypothetical protein